MSDWQDLTCQCKVRKRTPQTPGVAWTEQLQVSFCPLHSGNYDKTTINEAPVAPTVKENLTVAPVAEPPKPEKKLKRKKLTVAIAERAFPIALYSDANLKITEYRNDVEVKRMLGLDWTTDHFGKSELSIISAAWLAAHKSTEEKSE